MKFISALARSVVIAWEEASPKEKTLVLDRFTEELTTRKGISASQILKEVEKQLKLREMETTVIVETAFPNSNLKLGAYKKVLNQPSEQVIGGVRARRGHTIVDVSLADGLSQIRESLTA